MDINAIPLAARVEHHGIQYVRIDRVDRERVRSHAAAFGVFDAKGREFGYSYTIDRECHVIDGGGYTLHRIEGVENILEETFRVEPQGLRDGKFFGPLPVASYKRFRTLAEAEAYADNVIARAEKRAIKQASA